MAVHEQDKQSDAVPQAEWTDEKLISNFKRGDRDQCQQIIEVFHQRYAPSVLQAANKMDVTRDYAQDIANEVWLRFCQKMPEFVWQGKPVSHWLLATTRHVRLEIYRRITREKHIHDISFVPEEVVVFLKSRLRNIDPPLLEAVPHPEVKASANRWLAQALALLKPIDRQIINLLYYQNKNSTEIGKFLKMTPAAVRKRHERALKKLSGLLK